MGIYEYSHREERMQCKTNVIHKLLDTGGMRGDIEATISIMAASAGNEDYASNPLDEDDA
jgi:hypothetical protein